MNRAKAPLPGTIGVGSRVLYHLPWGAMKAEVIEDLGKFRGRRIMRILPFFEGVDGLDTDTFEVPEEDLTLAE
jgi:hypothetical protein